jgi:hypothetical protein
MYFWKTKPTMDYERKLRGVAGGRFPIPPKNIGALKNRIFERGNALAAA